MDRQKPYFAMILIQFIYAGMALFSKVALDGGMNNFVFVSYRQAIATVFLALFAFILERKRAPPLPFTVLCKIFLISLFGITLSLDLYCVALSYTSASLAAASTNAVPVITFFIAVLFRSEIINLRSFPGKTKVVGIAVCLAGVATLALYRGPSLYFWSNQHPSNQAQTNNLSSKSWIKGSFLMLSANTTWSLWLVLQASVLKTYPSKLLLTTLQCLFSTVQSAAIAVLFERNLDKWKLGLDVQLLSVAYCWGLWMAPIRYAQQFVYGPSVRKQHNSRVSWIKSTFFVDCAEFQVMACAQTVDHPKSTGLLMQDFSHRGAEGIVVTGITYWLQVWCIEKKGPVFTALFTPFSLLVTILFSTLQLGEVITWGSVVGEVLMIGGLYSVLWGKSKEHMDTKQADEQEIKSVEVKDMA